MTASSGLRPAALDNPKQALILTKQSRSESGNAIAGGIGSLTTNRPYKTVGSYWPFATTVFDYINRAMPYGDEKSLSPDQVYAVTAYVLYLSSIVTVDMVLNADNLTDVEMPNKNGFETLPGFKPASPH